MTQSQDFDIKKPSAGFRYRSGKTFAHSVGLSCAFRQWRAQSHCNLIHGYAIKVDFQWSALQLDERNWVVDFGSLKSLKGWLEDMFDHKTLVAEDDPKISIFRELEIAKLVELRVVPATGCEAMARMIFEYAEQWAKDNGYNGVRLDSVTVSEHEGNNATYERDPTYAGNHYYGIATHVNIHNHVTGFSITGGPSLAIDPNRVGRTEGYTTIAGTEPSFED